MGPDSALRVDTAFPLTAESVVFDIGGYHGAWAAAIWDAYQPAAIHVFEPVPGFADICRVMAAARDPERITIYQFGLAAASRRNFIYVDNDGSSFHFENGGTPIESRTVRVGEFFDERPDLTRVDVAKINIEGGEYDLLESIIADGQIRRFGHLLIQFHDAIPMAFSRRMAIAAALEATHVLAYNVPFVWERWNPK